MKRRLLLAFAAAAFGTVVAMAAGFVAFRAAPAGETGTRKANFSRSSASSPTRTGALEIDLGRHGDHDARGRPVGASHVKVNGVANRRGGRTGGRGPRDPG
jgi:hypothetical protein